MFRNFLLIIQFIFKNLDELRGLPPKGEVNHVVEPMVSATFIVKAPCKHILKKEMQQPISINTIANKSKVCKAPTSKVGRMSRKPKIEAPTRRPTRCRQNCQRSKERCPQHTIQEIHPAKRGEYNTLPTRS